MGLRWHQNLSASSGGGGGGNINCVCYCKVVVVFMLVYVQYVGGFVLMTRAELAELDVAAGHCVLPRYSSC